MKRSDLPKVVGASILSLSVALMPLALPAHAQSGGSGGSSGSGSTGGTTTGTADTNRNNDFDWGWLGLIGLLGLGGLAGRKNTEPARYRDPDEVTRPGSRL